jgi:hypothetical protein
MNQENIRFARPERIKPSGTRLVRLLADLVCLHLERFGQYFQTVFWIDPQLDVLEAI